MFVWLPRSRVFLLVVSLALALHIGGLVTPGFAATVIGDDETDRFVGSGAVVMPSSIAASTRRDAATCHGCRWKVTAPCQRYDEHPDAGCRGTILGCPQGREISRAWLAHPGQDFEPVGLYCPTDGEVTSVADMTRRVVDGFARRVPALTPTCAPQRGAVVGLPIHCHAGQPTAHLGWTDIVAGFSVATSAQAQWTWTLVETPTLGAAPAPVTVITDEPGGPYPAPGVRHAFRTAGRHGVSVDAIWSGTYTVDGLGPFPIIEAVRQNAGLVAPVGSALGVVRG